MSTTSLFVELIVIGAGALVWVALLAAAVLGFRWCLVADLLSPGPLVASLPFVYLLGILTDRIADKALKPWDEKLRGQVYESKQQYYDDHRILRTGSSEFSAMLDYGRSRMRICRGWVLNGVLIALSWPVLALSSSRLHGGLLRWLVAPAFLLLAIVCVWVWRDLSLTEYRKVHRQSKFVRQRSQS